MSIIALQLQEPAAGVVRGWWNILARELGITGINRVPFPHVTLAGCTGVEAPVIQEIMEDLSRKVPPLRLRSTGLGIFLDPEPVLYAPVVRDRPLEDLHHQIWEALSGLRGQMNPHHAPDRWMPHITLAQFDLRRDGLPKVLSTLAHLDLGLEFEVRNLTLFDWIGPRYEPQERYALYTQPFMGPWEPAEH